MAWNQSFSDIGKSGGGWNGDSSFVTGGKFAMDQRLTRLQERMAFPASISSILNDVDTSDKLVVGRFKFNTAQTIGVVSDIQTEDRAKFYFLTEPGGDSSSTLRVCKYENDDDTENEAKEIVEGSVILARGKLKSFDNQKSIMAFNVIEIDEQEQETFKLECILSNLYFTKNVPLMLRSGAGHQLDGTCVGRSTYKRNPTAQTHQPDRLYQQSSGGTNASQMERSHSFTGQRGKIMDLFAAEKANMGEDGISRAYIKEKINPTSDKSLATDLEFLISEGHLYTTTGDDMFATVGD